jgi:hypothetical protein
LDATVHVQRGHALIFPGKWRHCGQRITVRFASFSAKYQKFAGYPTGKGTSWSHTKEDDGSARCRDEVSYQCCYRVGIFGRTGILTKPPAASDRNCPGDDAAKQSTDLHVQRAQEISAGLRRIHRQTDHLLAAGAANARHIQQPLAQPVAACAVANKTPPLHRCHGRCWMKARIYTTLACIGYHSRCDP